jgi:predicted metal-binding membrane protein
MELAGIPRSVAGRSQLALIGSLFVLAVVGWTITDERMRGMDAGPGTDLGTLGFYVTAWVVMMAAMMFPSIWPMVTIYSRVQRGKAERGQVVPVGATALFVGGYLVTWTAAGLVAYVVFEAGRSLSIDAFSWDRGGPYLAGGVILAAAVYQLTPLKDVCLSKCRSPLMFVLHSWQPGRLGAVRMGIEHGAWCVGCCWALMAALFALGVMSLGWMVFIAALIATEKLLPWKQVANRGIAVILLVLGLSVAFAAKDVPGLVIPGSPEAMRAMEAMGMEGHESMGAGGGMTDEGTGHESMGAGGMEHEPGNATGGAAMEHEGAAGTAGGGAMQHEVSGTAGGGAMEHEAGGATGGAMEHEAGGAMENEPGGGAAHGDSMTK